jgi:hypothetical protein
MPEQREYAPDFSAKSMEWSNPTKPKRYGIRFREVGKDGSLHVWMGPSNYPNEDGTPKPYWRMAVDVMEPGASDWVEHSFTPTSFCYDTILTLVAKVAEHVEIGEGSAIGLEKTGGSGKSGWIASVKDGDGQRHLVDTSVDELIRHKWPAMEDGATASGTSVRRGESKMASRSWDEIRAIFKVALRDAAELWKQLRAEDKELPDPTARSLGALAVSMLIQADKAGALPEVPGPEVQGVSDSGITDDDIPF